MTAKIQAELSEKNWQENKLENQRQSQFLAAADLLVYVAGTYYIFGLWKGVFEEKSWYKSIFGDASWFGSVLNLIIVIVAFGVVHAVKKYLVKEIQQHR